MLGMDNSEEDVEKEIDGIMTAINNGERSYILKYCSDAFETDKPEQKK